MSDNESLEAKYGRRKTTVTQKIDNNRDNNQENDNIYLLFGHGGAREVLPSLLAHGFPEDHVLPYYTVLPTSGQPPFLKTSP